MVYLFDPKVMPTSTNVASPQLLIGAIGNMYFIDRKTNKPAPADMNVINLSNFGNIRISPSNKKGDNVLILRWKHKKMNKYKLEGEIIGFDSIKLLDITTQERITEIAARINNYCK